MSKNYKETDKYIFFYGGIFSQWYPCDIVIDNIKYCTCEQYMMSQKAKLFGDDYVFKQIMLAHDPSIQKSWGRRVEGFDKDKWDSIARDVVYKANYAKFTQHEDWKQNLLSTGDKTIVEASPYDRIWGIGLGCDDPRALNPDKWKGTNWLGEAIMKVREEIRTKDDLAFGCEAFKWD